MRPNRFPILALGAVLALGACSNPFGGGNPFRGETDPTLRPDGFGELEPIGQPDRDNGSFLDLFTNGDDPNTTVEVNRYIWNAALDVLDFLPVQQVDPFSGVITTGYGTPPGGGRAYRATVLVRDPALDARSLSVALQDRSGRPVAVETQRAVEDAILTRARQLRIASGDL